MTIQQEAHMLIDNMPDKSVEYVVELLHNMKSSFLKNSEADTVRENVSTQRIGTAAGRIQYPDDLNKYDDEMAFITHDGLMLYYNEPCVIKV